MPPASGCEKCFNERVASTYASYARFISKYGAFVFLVGFILAVLACVGLVNIETTSDVLNIWMYRGTRLDGEKDYYEEYFGGDPRTQNIIISAETGSTAVTSVGLDAMLEASEVFVSGGEDEITYTWVGDDGNETTLGVSDVCVSPPVPTVMAPYSADTSAAIPTWLQEGAYISYGYRHVSLCAKNGTGVIPVPEPDLEYGWGIDRFPCSRLTPLDCFQEGNYDYPEAMQQLDLWSTFVAFNDANKTAECVAEFGAEFQTILEYVGTSTAEAEASATALMTQLESTILAFWSWGYRWRKSYASMTDDEIYDHLSDALAFAVSDDEPVTSCVATGAPCCLSWAATKLEVDLLFADVDETEKSIKYTMLSQANFPINHPAWISRMEELNITEEGDREDIALGWETNFIKAMMPRFEEDEGSGYDDGEVFEDLELDFFAERSGDDIVENGNEPEAYLIWIAYVGMLLFAAVSMGSWNCRTPRSMALYSRVLLSLGGMCVIAFSTLACLGFISTVGVKLTPLSVTVVPFLSLGIGIDDMYIFVYTLLLATGSPDNPGKRLEATLIHAGPSVTITSISNAGCFFVASAVPIQTVRNFAVHMGTQMLFHLVLFHLLLVPMMYWDSVRVKNKRADLVPFIKLADNGVVPEHEFADASGAKWFVEKLYSPILRNKLFKVFVVAGALVMTAVLTWYGVTENTLGVGLNTLAEEGSHEAHFLEIFEESFTGDALSLVTKEVDMGTYQQTLLDVQDAVEEVKWVSDVSTVKDNSWLADSSSSFLGSEATPVDADDFNSLFAEWITGAGITNANNFYCATGTDGPRVDCTEFDADTTVIKASIQRVYVTDQNTRENNIRMFNDMRDAVDGVDPDRDTYAYSDNFALHSQYLYTWQTFFWVIGGGAVVVAVVILLLQGSIVISLLITTSIVMVVLQVFGFLAVIDVGMNGFSTVNLCIMVGLVVEFTAHISRGFLFAAGDTLDDRVERALTELLWPTFAGACTTFLAVLPLRFSKISFFHGYYFETFAIMSALGFLTGVCLLPVVLSVVGPASMRLEKHAWSEKAHGEPVNQMALVRSGDGQPPTGKDFVATGTI